MTKKKKGDPRCLDQVLLLFSVAVKEIKTYVFWRDVLAEFIIDFIIIFTATAVGLKVRMDGLMDGWMDGWMHGWID